MTQSKTKLSRSIGVALTPKAERIMRRRGFPPGQHGRTRRKSDSDYSIRLKEKQRLKFQYGIREAQLRKDYNAAQKLKGLSGDNLIALLETRLDALVLRSGFARSISQARQFVVHGHILVDGKRIDRPSYKVTPGQLIHVAPKSETNGVFQAAAQGAHIAVLPDIPAYLDVDIEKLESRLERMPERQEVPIQCDVQLVVEYYAAR